MNENMIALLNCIKQQYEMRVSMLKHDIEAEKDIWSRFSREVELQNLEIFHSLFLNVIFMALKDAENAIIEEKEHQ